MTWLKVNKTEIILFVYTDQSEQIGRKPISFQYSQTGLNMQIIRNKNKTDHKSIKWQKKLRSNFFTIFTTRFLHIQMI